MEKPKHATLQPPVWTGVALQGSLAGHLDALRRPRDQARPIAPALTPTPRSRARRVVLLGFRNGDIQIL